jgi:predicted ATP-grasp superfamily ATP-dependent carboligase
VPVADVATALVAERRSLFEPRCLVACADAEVIARAADKAELLHRATRLGVPAPRSWFLDTPDAPLDADLPFPIVVKPHRSRVRTASGWVSCTVGYAASREELAAELARRAPAQFPIILQERIVGPGAGVFACMADGAPVALFSHRRLREKPPWGGVSVLSESAPIDPRARATTRSVCSPISAGAAWRWWSSRSMSVTANRA